MERQTKSALKKTDVVLKNGHHQNGTQKKVHFSPKKMDSTKTTPRKRQPNNQQSVIKKVKLCDTLGDLYKSEKLLIESEGQLQYLEKKLEKVAIDFSRQFLEISNVVCDLIALDNKLSDYVENLTHHERKVERSVEEVDLTRIDLNYEKAKEADDLYARLIRSLTATLNFVEQDKLDMLPDEVTSIESTLQKMTLISA